jgi:hypothetical protein
MICPDILSLGLTKHAAWYMIQNLVAIYKDQGFRFYFVDERTPEGKGMFFISGQAHADLFLELTERDDQGSPLATFVRGVGLQSFPSDESASLPVLTLEEAADDKYGYF